jgi:dipeptidase E
MAAAVPRIVAIGGGGFSDEPGASPIDDLILGLSGRARPRVCFVPTASADSEAYVTRFFDAFSRLAEASWLPLFKRRDADLRRLIMDQDVVYVSGGNTANLLAVWRAHGLDTVLREAWQAGVVLAGVSAGAMCWFEAGVTDSFGPGLAPLPDGLGMLAGSFCPHHDSEADRRPRYRQLVTEGLPGGWACDDGAALVFQGSLLADVVSERDGAGAYRVEIVDGAVRETARPARFLGAR